MEVLVEFVLAAETRGGSGDAEGFEDHGEGGDDLFAVGGMVGVLTDGRAE